MKRIETQSPANKKLLGRMRRMKPKPAVHVLKQEPKLKPCRCGGNAKLLQLASWRRFKHFVSCDKCGVQTSYVSAPELAASVWNKAASGKVAPTPKS